MKKFALFAAFVLAGCFSDVPEDHGIIVPGCDAPETDPNRVCEGDTGGGGGGTGGGGGSSGGGQVSCNGVACPVGQVCWSNRIVPVCGPRPGTRCLVGQEPAGTRCYIDINGWCKCYLINPPPNTFSEESGE